VPSAAIAAVLKARLATGRPTILFRSFTAVSPCSDSVATSVNHVLAKLTRSVTKWSLFSSVFIHKVAKQSENVPLQG
jgi:hypothetical protein